MNILKYVLPIIFGFILDMILGDPYRLPHPIRLIGRLISVLEKLFRKIMQQNEKMAGFFLSIIVLTVSSFIPLTLLLLCYHFNVWLGIIVESIMCYYLVAAKSLKIESMKVYNAIAENDTERARKAVSMIVGRDTECLDESGIIKAAVETVAENTSDGVTAPLMFIMLGGATFGFFYKAANTLDSMIGYKNDKYINLGRFSAKLDDVLNFIPSRLTALIMILSATLLGYDGKNAYKIWRRDRFNHASPNSAQTEAVCAGALNVQLAGNAYYFGELYEKKTIGDDIQPVKNEDIKRVNRLMYCTSIFTLLLAVLIRATCGIILGGVI